MKIAGAPISWGVCEVPDWGYQLPAGRVLGEMRELGLAATEYGPDGYLTTGQITAAGLEPAGAFVPVVLHDPGAAAVVKHDKPCMLVLAAATGADDYEASPELDDRGWRTLLENLDAAAGPAVTLHPHVGTIIDHNDGVLRVLRDSQIKICLDTGHLLIGGTDPAELARKAPDRIGHVHLKDVSERLASRVREGSLSYFQAVKQGLYQPLGDGDADIAGVVAALSAAGYDGWYVLEQDTVLTGAGDDPKRDVARSLDYLKKLA